MLNWLYDTIVDLTKAEMLTKVAGCTTEEFTDAMMRQGELRQLEKAALAAAASTKLLTKGEFLATATDVEVLIGNTPLVATVKPFSTGSFGYYANGKVNVKVGDRNVLCQVGCTITVVGSKPKD